MISDPIVGLDSAVCDEKAIRQKRVIAISFIDGKDLRSRYVRSR
jgi:hypothetical protein